MGSLNIVLLHLQYVAAGDYFSLWAPFFQSFSQLVDLTAYREKKLLYFRAGSGRLEDTI